MSLHHSPKIAIDGLVLYLDAGNPKSYPRSGNTWLDLSGYNNHGTLINGVGYTANNKGSFIFDGSNDYVDIGKPLVSNNMNFTICILLKSNGIQNGYTCPISQGHASYTGFTIQSGYPISSMSFVAGNNSSWNGIPFNYHPGMELTYTFLTVTNSNNLLQTYKNSQYVANTTLNILHNSCSVNIGRDTLNTDANHRCFNGNIPIVQIYNRALSADEVKQNFNALRGRYGI